MSTKKKTVVEKNILEKLQDVLDPELYISIVDLGLIYDINEHKGHATIKMTLTTMGCPLFDTLEQEIKQKTMSISGIEKVDIDLVFDPPWTMDRLTERARAMMGI